jgi:hypothetical protein
LAAARVRQAQEVEAHLHARGDPAGGDDPPGVDHPGTTDPARRGEVGQPVDGHLAVRAASARSGSLRFVAASPSRSPMTAYTHEPVHTLVSSVVDGWARMNSCRRRLCISWRVPNPPGMRNASIAGSSEKL